MGEGCCMKAAEKRGWGGGDDKIGRIVAMHVGVRRYRGGPDKIDRRRSGRYKPTTSTGKRALICFL
jgi:hypothetical protein